MTIPIGYKMMFDNEHGQMVTVKSSTPTMYVVTYTVKHSKAERTRVYDSLGVHAVASQPGLLITNINEIEIKLWPSFTAIILASIKQLFA